MVRKRPEKIDVERALEEPAATRGGTSAEGDIEIVEVVGGEPGAEGAPEGAETAESPVEAESAQPPDAAADLLERLKRLQAEYENYRKRVERDRAQHREQASAELAREMLPVLDSLERALARRVDGGASEFRSGVELIQRQLLDVLTRMGLEPLEALGQRFDPELHEAVATTVDARQPSGQVLEVFERGYRLRGRLLRPARVRVSAGPDQRTGAA